MMYTPVSAGDVSMCLRGKTNAVAGILENSDLRKTVTTRPTECVTGAMCSVAPTNFTSCHNNGTHHYQNAADCRSVEVRA